METTLDTQMDLAGALLGALPEKFDFYHLGAIEASPAIRPAGFSVADSFEGLSLLGYRFHGDLEAVLVLGFEPGLDASVYAEAGNIVASRTAHRLNEKNELDVMISPPQALSNEALLRLLRTSAPLLHRLYLHRHGDDAIPLQMVILPVARGHGGVGHA